MIDQQNYRPMMINELAKSLSVPVESWPEFFNMLKQLEIEGAITVAKSKKVMKADRKNVQTANMRTVTGKGGYASLTDQSSDVFIDKKDLRGAMPTDVITVRILKRSGRLPQAEVIKVVERKFIEFTGTLYKRGKHAYIIPDSGTKEKLEVGPVDSREAKDRDKVLAKIKKYSGKGHTTPTAQIITSYGSSESAAACSLAVLDRYHVRRDFPAVVSEQAKQASADLQIEPSRLDLRGQPIFTIDGATAKDLDDAVSVEKTGKGYRLGVHIADVSHYVRAGSELDKEAFKRGTSVYYADKVIPMLPKELSNGICSLNPKEDRMTFSALIELDNGGRILSYELKKSVINSRVKGVYDEINRLFGGSESPEIREKYREVLPELTLMRRLYEILHAARLQRGAMDFETDESEIVIGAGGTAVDIKKRVRGDAEKMIEEFMLCANEVVATFAQSDAIPFVYRVHEEPDARKLEVLKAALKAAGISDRSIHSGLRPSDMAALLKAIEGSPKAKALNDLVLRSMAKAKYSPECAGHFGLSLKNYCHFTSPIRRYPDLAIHRILGDCLKNGNDDKLKRRYGSFVEEASIHSSEREVAAMQLEWDCEAIYKAEYMTAHIGEQFIGTVTSVKSFGMYVTLENTVEGLVRVENLPGGWYDYDEASISLYCAQNGRRYTIGDEVKIIVAKAEVATGRIDFEVL